MAKDLRLPIVYSCSGCSSAAQMANSLAIHMDRQGIAEMSCIAGVGGGVQSLVLKAKSGRPLWVIDGCPLSCGKACLANQGLTPDVHFDLSKMGAPKKLHQDFDSDQAQSIYQKLLQALITEKKNE